MKSYQKLNLILIIFYVLIVFLVDYVLHWKIAVWALYVPIIFLTSVLFDSKKIVLLVAITISCLELVSGQISPPDLFDGYFVANRVIGLLTIWISCSIGLIFIRKNIEASALENQFKAGIEAASTAVVMVNRTGTISMVNRQAENLFQYNRGEMIGAKIETLLPPILRKKHVTDRSQYMVRPETRAMGAGRDLKAVKKNGEEFPVEVGLTPIPGKNEMFVMSSIVDITPRKAAEKAIKEQNRALAVANEELSQFAYRTSHDLKAPLLTIRGLANYIKKDLESGDHGEAIANSVKIVQQSTRLEKLVTDILDLAKADLAESESTTLNLNALLNEICEKFEDLSSAAQVKIEKNIHLHKPFFAQKPRLSQILENLISNAIKYHDPQKTLRFVKISIWEHENELILQVKDNGLGIPPEHLKDLFKMFSRFHPDVAFGSGLGTSIVKKHVDRMGGIIDVESSSDGTLFTIHIPAHPEHPIT